MNSVFARMEEELSPRFWIPCVNVGTSKLVFDSDGLYSGELLVKQGSNQLRPRHFVGTREKLFFLKVQS